MIYFDHNATTPPLPEAKQTWLEICDQFFGNPSSPHRLGSRADRALNEAKEKLAAVLGCHAEDIAFTSGATESNNMVLHHYARTLSADTEVWISAIEHPCLLEPARYYFGRRLQFIPVTSDGLTELNWIREKLKRSRPALIAVMAANNETGALQPWSEVMDLCHEREVPFFCDAVQWLGKLPAGQLGECDWVTGSAHKFGGTRGVGFVKVPARLSIIPLLRGGPQEAARRAGTENVAGASAMVAALEIREKQIAQSNPSKLAKRRDAFERQLMSIIPGSQILSAKVPRLWNTASALMPETDCRQRWVVKLDKLGLAVSTGSACSSGKEAPSHVLRAMGMSAKDAGRVLRFSAGWETSASDWSALIHALNLVGKMTPRPAKKNLAKSRTTQ